MIPPPPLTFNILRLDSLAAVTGVAGSGHAGRISAENKEKADFESSYITPRYLLSIS